MTLVYLAPSDLQIARVDRQCIVSFCEALQRLGVEVELVALRIRLLDVEIRRSDPLDLYRIRTRFPVRLVRVPVSQESPDWWIAANRLAVHVSAAVTRTFRRGDNQPFVFYEKNYAPALALLVLRPLLPRRPLVVFEAHLPPRRRLQRFVLRNVDLVVANTYALAADLVAEHAAAPERVIGVHQGVDLELLADSERPKEDARALVGLSLEKKLVVYTGKIYWGYREIDYILAAAKALRARDDIHFVLVGGRRDHVERLRRRARDDGIDNVTFTGFVPPTVAPAYQRAADVLLLYYPSAMELNKYRSPGKLFEYMASGRPVIAVDLPVMREVLGDDPAALMVPPDSPDRLAEAILELLADPREAERLAESASRRAAAFTWDARARTVLAAVERAAGAHGGSATGEAPGGAAS